jgi:Histidine kinase-, DNA gyrase B-, and HSP90-like ATPase
MHHEAENLMFSVDVEGGGPPTDIGDHLFEPFVTGRADGTGLGLSLVREVAAAHAGIEVQSRVRMALHGPRGDVNGALLEDGTVLRLPPPEAERFASILQPGQILIAEGAELASPLGKVLEVRQIGASRDQLNQVQAPGPGGKKGRRGPPPV